VPANKALQQSLNVPYIFLLQKFGVENFKTTLRQNNFLQACSNKDIGLPLIVGGTEVSLKELVNAYLGMSSLVQNGKSIVTNMDGKITENKNYMFDKACAYTTLITLQDRKRPDGLGNWQVYNNQQNIAWKTGTSYGNRDAWCIGSSPSYIVGVWLGNANGTADNRLIGTQLAAPIMFDIFNSLPKTNTTWQKPKTGWVQANICTQSGYLANSHCTEKVSNSIPSTCLTTMVCPYHTKDGYTLPHQMAKYAGLSSGADIGIDYPHEQAILSGTELVATAHASGLLHWFVDDKYLGATNTIHQMPIALVAGKHLLTIENQAGEQQQLYYIVP
jgi:penicillin-binding protein 1C